MKVDVDAPTDDDEGRQIAAFILFQIGHAGFGFESSLMIDLRGEIGLNHGGGLGQGLPPHPL